MGELGIIPVRYDLLKHCSKCRKSKDKFLHNEVISYHEAANNDVSCHSCEPANFKKFYEKKM